MAGDYPFKHIVDRTVRMAFKPADGWAEVSQENPTAAECYKRYLLVAQVVPAVATFLGLALFGYAAGPLGNIRVPVGHALGAGISAYIQGLFVAGLVGFLASLLAPRFGGAGSLDRGVALATMSFLPAAAAGALMIFPTAGIVTVLVGLYSLYVLFLGIEPMMGVPADRKVPYAVLLVVVAIVVVALFQGLSRGVVW